MLKFLLVAQNSNFLSFLTDFSNDFKHVVHSRLNELLNLPLMVEKLEMSNFQSNLNHIKIQHVTSDMYQIVHKCLI
jgi:hypothetical protein